MKQKVLFKEDKNYKYSQATEKPIYSPKNKKPHIIELVNKSKTNRLITEIINSNVSNEEKDFLIMAAGRHNVFNYALIADYYAHSGKEMQQLMEHSALVIIDFEQAIELGFVQLSKNIKEACLTV